MNINWKSALLLVIRLAVAYFFVKHGIDKLTTPEMAGFVGGAFHNLGLTFLSQSTWLTVLGVGEVLIGLGFALGGLSRTAAVFALIIMLGAMNAKGWNTSAITKDALLALGSLIIIACGAGAYSLDTCCCKKGNKKCCGGSCHDKSDKNNYKDKEVIEA